ncbi:MAG: hypothetical protein JWM95_603 [Gemmatimonadetes bacterium]|nr:hypothetical protein [Gemmatimonadota bacterium]
MTKQPRTVLAVIETDGPGGAETVFLELLRNLDPARWRGIAVIPGTGWLHDQLVHSGVETYIVPERSTLDYRYFARLARLVRHHHVSLLHGHLLGSSIRVAMLSRLVGIPAIATLHGAADIGQRERFFAIKRLLLRRLCRVVYVSQSLSVELHEQLDIPGLSSTVIPNGIDASRFRSAGRSSFRASLGIADDEFVVGSVGNLNAAKGFDVLLRAVALIRSQGVKLRAVIVGDDIGRESAALRAMHRTLGLSDAVIFTGFRKDIPDALASFDIYALTSRSEGFAISLVEAMAAACPVVATRCGGPEYIVDHEETGILVENGSPEAVAEALLRLYEDPRLATRLGNAARASVTERYTLDAQALLYQKEYDSCAR